MQPSKTVDKKSVSNAESSVFSSVQIVEVIVAARLNKSLCYLNNTGRLLETGELVRVPLGRQVTTGIVIGEGQDSGEFALKPIQEQIEGTRKIPLELLDLFHWAARYYHAPIGQVLSTALPKSLLEGKPAKAQAHPVWKVVSTTNAQATPKQQQLLDWLAGQGGATTNKILDAGFGRHLLKALRDKTLVEIQEKIDDIRTLLAESPLTPNSEQSRALESIQLKSGPFLLQGVTGSGKTEVYLQVAQQALANGKQVLFLVPEIGLITQTIERLKARFNCQVLGYHSAASESEKVACWNQSANSIPLIVVGTRSAVFLPFTKPGLIVIDEEQDLSYKQFEGIRYNARDLALIRARKTGAKLILGSATPSLESLYNTERGHYQMLKLENRVAKKSLPKWRLVQADQTSAAPLSNQVMSCIGNELSQGGQVLIFLNRRGYAPILTCTNCAWSAICQACDSQMCIHQQPRALVCHRCDGRLSVPTNCPACGSGKLETRGFGTEQLEDFLSKSFPHVPCLRIDRDSTQRKNAFSEKLFQLHSGDPALLIGTQMITKGHHLPGISLVVALGADSALYSHDFRAIEHLSQTLIQVAGRSGRGDRPGQILVETSQPDHPLLEQLCQQGYDQVSRNLLEMRKQHGLPPIGYSAALHASSTDLKLVSQFMASLEAGPGNVPVEYIGPMPSIIERKAGRYRYQIRFFAKTRSELHSELAKLENRITQMKGFSKIRWAIDIDPLTMD
ncbi:MAG: primosomal protein N' [Pseudomonadales bacterium]